MKKKLLPSVVLLFSLLVVGFSFNSIMIDYFKAKSSGDRIILEWKSLSEVGLVKYVIERKKENQAEFESIKEFTPTGDGSVYQFSDMGVYKTSNERVYYRLKMQSRHPQTGDINEVVMESSTTFQSTAVRKTWGSIKAMFK